MKPTTQEIVEGLRKMLIDLDNPNHDIINSARIALEDKEENSQFYYGRGFKDGMIQESDILKSYEKSKPFLKEIKNAFGEPKEEVCGCGTKYSEHGNGANGYCTAIHPVSGASGAGWNPPPQEEKECKCKPLSGQPCFFAQCDCKCHFPTSDFKKIEKLTGGTQSEVIEKIQELIEAWNSGRN